MTVTIMGEDGKIWESTKHARAIYNLAHASVARPRAWAPTGDDADGSEEVLVSQLPRCLSDKQKLRRLCGDFRRNVRPSLRNRPWRFDRCRI